MKKGIVFFCYVFGNLIFCYSATFWHQNGNDS